jgi:hypothetical protein
MARGGDLLDASWTHPTLGQGTLYFKAGEDSSYNTGGFMSDDDDQGVDGGGVFIDKLTRERCFFKGVAVNDMEVSTIEKVKALAGSPQLATWTFSCANGFVYKVTGKPVGSMEANVNASTFDLKVAGGGTATQIV